jgi:hypothetical protein
VGVAEVASLARSAFPGRVLFDMRYRDRGDERFWATSSINSFNTLFYTMRVDAATGATEEGETEEILPPADIETGAVVARLGELEIDFTHAVAAANAATGKSEADLYRIGLSSATSTTLGCSSMASPEQSSSMARMPRRRTP